MTTRRAALRLMLAAAGGSLVPARQTLAQVQPPAFPPTGPGPWDHDVHLLRQWPDGTSDRLALFERSGVPTLVRLPDRRLAAAHQWFPETAPESFDTIAVRFSEDDGRTWTAPRTLGLEGLPPGTRFPFDPTLLVLPDGRLRMYATLNGTVAGGTPRIGSFLSDDGLVYRFEPGDRLAVPGEMVIDTASVSHGGLVHLYAPVQGPPGRAYHAVSRDGLVFERQPDVALDGGVRWLGCAVSDGVRMRFYGTVEGGLWVAESADGFGFGPPTWIPSDGADPGVVEEPDGSRLVLLTGPPRPGTPSATPR